MNLKTLESRGLIKQFLPINPKNIQAQLAISDRDLASAKRNLADDPEIAHNLAYTAILAAGRSLMVAHGYRPDGNSKHYSVEVFLTNFLNKSYITVFGNMRRKRHNAEYEFVGGISDEEAKNAITDAETIIPEIKSMIEQMGFQI